MMRLREIIKNIKNWQVDLSDSLVQLFSTRLFTFLGLDINFDASNSLSVGRDLINWFDHYSWKTNRAHFTPHMSAHSVLWNLYVSISVYPGNILSDTWLFLWVTACLHSLFAYCSWYIFTSLSLHHFINVLVASIIWFTPSFTEAFFISYTCISSFSENNLEML